MFVLSGTHIAGQFVMYPTAWLSEKQLIYKCLNKFIELNNQLKISFCWLEQVSFVYLYDNTIIQNEAVRSLQEYMK